MAHITAPAFILLPANIAQLYCCAYMSNGLGNALINKRRDIATPLGDVLPPGGDKLLKYIVVHICPMDLLLH